VAASWAFLDSDLIRRSARNRMLAGFGGELGDAPAKQVCYLQRSREPLFGFHFDE
jgi:hypothetical protein